MEQKADQSFIQNAVWRVQLRVGFVRIEVDDPYCRTDVVTSYGRFRAAATTASMTEVRAQSRSIELLIPETFPPRGTAPLGAGPDSLKSLYAPLAPEHPLCLRRGTLPCSRSSYARTVSAKLQRKWSLEQIAGWLKRTYPGEPLKQVSHETIYRSLYIQARGVLKKELLEHLRARRTIRRSRHASIKRSGLGQIKDAISISERPPSVEDRAVPGHWEGDLIGGFRNSYIATLVERHSRYVMLIKVANKDTESVVSALIRQSQKLPTELYQSLTWDRGKELADHQRLAMAADVEIYFCDPRSPWQRGSNENTNRLLRQYLPRGTDLSVHSQAKLSAIARQLNERPRKTLLYQTPAERFAECVAAIS